MLPPRVPRFFADEFCDLRLGDFAIERAAVQGFQSLNDPITQ
jgi:hypothetical protein